MQIHRTNLVQPASSRSSLARHLQALAALLILAPLADPAAAAESSMLQSDFPFQAACITAPHPKGNVAYKGIAIRLGSDSAICFDTDLLRVSAGWTGGYISTHGVAYDGAHGGNPEIVGQQQFGTRQSPGWADAAGSFNDPRTVELYGPLPESQGRWGGLYVTGGDVVLTYTVLGTAVEEQPSIVEENGHRAFVRSFNLGPSKKPLTLLVADAEKAILDAPGSSVALTEGTASSVVTLGSTPKGTHLEVIDQTRAVVRIPASRQGTRFKVLIGSGSAADFTKAAAAPVQLTPVLQGGKAHWPQEVVTNGVLSVNTTPDGTYTVDQLSAPSRNPWNRRVRFAGVDFFRDGKRAALCTWDGDVWVVSGLDEKLEHLSWRRFASGGYETLGLKIVDDVIYTSGRDQITRYKDLNKDGEADFYENFNNQATSSAGFHEFQFDLKTDPKGNFYTVKAGPVNGGGSGFGSGGGNGVVTAYAGTLQKISKDGRRREIIATGFRAPNGIGVSPTGQITTSDNEGTWVPQCPINWIKPGGFYGVETLAHANPIPPYNQPLCWLSKNDTDNSGGGQVWVTSDRWGPYQGDLLHLSYGKCRLYLVMKEEVEGVMQGGVVQIPVRFTSSAMRGHFNPADGQLYICGLQGWQTTAAKLTGFDRVRYTGKPVVSVHGLNVTHDGLRLTFTQPLDAATASDTQNYTVRRWNYRRTGEYGSPEVSVLDPKKELKGPGQREVVDIKSATVSKDGLGVTLVLEDLRPVMQESVKFSLKTRFGTDFTQEIQHTINKIPAK